MAVGGVPMKNRNDSMQISGQEIKKENKKSEKEILVHMSFLKEGPELSELLKKYFIHLKQS